jgi:hypothetical protein
VKEHANFYENLKESHIRLRNTVVMYDGEPYFIFAITTHKDGIFRVYMYPIGEANSQVIRDCLVITQNYPADYPSLGEMLDQAIAGKEGVLRKHINSPSFGRFRPFPLGMCNIKGKGTYYVERQPNRHTPQGLTTSMLYDVEITAASSLSQSPRARIDLISNDFRNCILGKYPTPHECLAGLLNPDISNEAAGFHRQFAFVRGPIQMIFLAYKEDVVGVLPKSDLSILRIGREYRHTREVIQELGLFDEIVVQ